MHVIFSMKIEPFQELILVHGKIWLLDKKLPQLIDVLFTKANFLIAWGYDELN